jgi:hypothetical protein
MVWGNNVFSYDNALMVRNLGRVSRSLEQLEAISIGIYPHVSLMVNDANRDKANALWRLRMHLLIVVWLGSLATLTLLISLVAWVKVRRRQESVYP